MNTNFFIQRYKSTTMQRIQELVIRGYNYHTQGEIHYSKASNFVKKFQEKYHISLSSRQRSYRKSCGKGNAHLLLYPDTNTENFLWWLLVTDGEHPAHKNENLNLATDRKNRVTWKDEYELLRYANANKHSWTWKMIPENYSYWESSIRKSISIPDNIHYKQTLYTLLRCPGFSGIRDQVKDLIKIFKADWKRIRKNTNNLPAIPKKIFYIARLPNEHIAIDDIISFKMKGKIEWFPRKK